jgi:hypothetical protein
VNIRTFDFIGCQDNPSRAKGMSLDGPENIASFRGSGFDLIYFLQLA